MLRLLCALLVPVLLAGCSGQLGPGPMPIPERRTPPTGPGHLTGRLTVDAPQLLIYTSGFDQPRPQGAQLQLDLALGLFDARDALFTSGSRRIFAVRNQQPFSLLLNDANDYTAHFTFGDVPLSSYVLALYRDSGDEVFGPLLRAGGALSLTEAQPTLTDAAPELALLSGPASLRGKLLLAGYDGATPAVLRVLSYSGTAGPAGEALNYLLPGAPDFGRYFYALNGLPEAETTLSLYGGNAGANRLYVEDSFLQGTTVRLDDFGPELSADLVGLPIDHRGDSLWVEDARSERGQITVNLRVTGNLDWDFDLVLVAEAASNGSGPRHAWAHVRPEQLGLGGRLEVPLAYLGLGDYRVRALRLGAANTDPVEELAHGDATLVLPPTQTLQDGGLPVTVQPYPHADAALTIELP